MVIPCGVASCLRLMAKFQVSETSLFCLTYRPSHQSKPSGDMERMPLTLTQVGTFVSNPAFYIQVLYLTRAVVGPSHSDHWDWPKISYLHLTFGIRPESRLLRKDDNTWLQGSEVCFLADASICINIWMDAEQLLGMRL